MPAMARKPRSVCMRRRTIPRPAAPAGAIPLLVFLAGGCTLGKTNPSRAVDPVPAAPTAAATSPRPRPAPVFRRAMRHFAVEFRVHRITARRGAFCESAELWKIVPGPLPDADAAQRLAANGFRAAIGRASDRKPLLAFLQALEDPRTAVDQVLPDVSREVRLEIGPCPPRLSVFFYDRHGDLVGLDFANARARLTWSFEIDSTRRREIRLRVTPELEEPPGPPRWEISSEGVARRVPRERRHAFEDLTFETPIPEDGFLILAATPEVYRTPSPGRPFFVTSGPVPGDWLEGARESLYIISPIIRADHRDDPSGDGGPS